MNQHKDAVRLALASNAVFEHVRDTIHSINWRAAKLVFIFNVESLRLAVEYALIRKTPNFNNAQIALGVDALSSEISLKSKPESMSRVLNLFSRLVLGSFSFLMIFL